jgi:hypothetical protein
MSTNSSWPTRRSFASAAVGAVSLLFMHLAAAGDARSNEPSNQADSQMGMTQAVAIRPFRITVPEEHLVDLRRRIVATRWSDRETVNDQSQGIQLVKLQELVRYWGTGYDWRKAETKLNARSSSPASTASTSTSFTFARSMPMLCP